MSNTLEILAPAGNREMLGAAVFSGADAVYLGLTGFNARRTAGNFTPEELQAVVGKRGYFPEDMPIRDYPADFVEGCLVAAWPQVLQMVLDNRDLPF